MSEEDIDDNNETPECKCCGDTKEYDEGFGPEPCTACEDD